MTSTASGLGDMEARDHLDQIQIPAKGPGRRFMLQFVALALVACISIAGFYAAVDPHDKFASDAYRPLIVDWTESKVKLLERQEEIPTAIIMGSSRAMALDPSYTAAGLGSSSAFSLAIPSSTAQDSSILFDYLVSSDQVPDTLVVAVDLDVRANIGSVAQQSAAYKRLTGQQPDLLDQVSTIGRAFSVSGIMDSIQVLQFTYVTGYPAERMALQPDGGTAWIQAEQVRQSGTFDLDEAIDEHLQTQVRKYYDIDAPSSEFLFLIEELTKKAEANGVRLHLFVPPVHPRLADAIYDVVPWLADYEHDAVVSLTGLCSELVTVHDFRDLETFGGDPDDFFDGWHYLEKNGRLMVDAMASGAGSRCEGNSS